MKKIIDSKGRIGGRLSIIDALFLAVVLVMIVAVYSRFNVIETPALAPVTYEVTYTIFIPTVRATNANLLRPGDLVFSTDTGVNIGRIIRVEKTPAMHPEPTLDGTIVMAEFHERYNVIITLVTQASISDGRIFADRSFELNENAHNRIHTKFNEFDTTFIFSIDR